MRGREASGKGRAGSNPSSLTHRRSPIAARPLPHRPMNTFSTPAIMLRRTDFGEDDLIITLFTPEGGKVSALAKSAKKSRKRFGGILQPFSMLDVVCIRGRRLPILQEAALREPFVQIRSDIRKVAYASYWAELITGWLEDGQEQTDLYHLFSHVLEELNVGDTPEAVLSILFQMRFMIMAGLYPNLRHCGNCGMEMEKMEKNRVMFDLAGGELVCERCVSEIIRPIYLSKGTVKQLLWIGNSDLKKAGRVRFSPWSLREGLEFLEAFVPYHLGKSPRSLAVLRQVRRFAVPPSGGVAPPKGGTANLKK